MQQLCRIPTAELDLSSDDTDDVDVYVYATIHEPDKSGGPILTINVPRSTIPPNSIDKIPEDEMSDILLYFVHIGLLRASYREIDPSGSMHSNYPLHPYAIVQKVPKGDIVPLKFGIFALSVAYDAGESMHIDVQGQTPQIQSFATLEDKLSMKDNFSVHKVNAGLDYPSYIGLPLFCVSDKTSRSFLFSKTNTPSKLLFILYLIQRLCLCT